MTVYFVQDGGPEGHVKIGYTGTAAGAFGRIAQLQTGNPRPMKLLVCIPNGTAAEEKALHERFKDLRGSGEWFRPDARLLGFIEGLRVAYPDQPKDPGPDPEPLVCGLTLDQLHTIAGFCRARELAWRAAYLVRNNVIDAVTTEMSMPDVIACTEAITDLQEHIERVSARATWEDVGRLAALDEAHAQQCVTAFIAALRSHNQVIEFRSAEERLVADGMTGALELPDCAGPDVAEKDYPF